MSDIDKLEHHVQTVSERLASLAERLPGVDPGLWFELKGIIKDAALAESKPGSLESARAVVMAGVSTPCQDRGDFERECSDRLIDIAVDEHGDYRAQVTRTLWWFWRVRGQQLRDGFFDQQAAECQALRSTVAENLAHSEHASARCQQMIKTLHQHQGAAQ